MEFLWEQLGKSTNSKLLKTFSLISCLSEALPQTSKLRLTLGTKLEAQRSQIRRMNTEKEKKRIIIFLRISFFVKIL